MNDEIEHNKSQLPGETRRISNNEVHQNTVKNPDNHHDERSKETHVRPKITPPYAGAVQNQHNNTLSRNELAKPMIKPRKRKLKFEDRYKRITTFLENDLYDDVMELKENDEIDSIVQIVNDSIKQYLLKKYPKNRS